MRRAFLALIALMAWSLQMPAWAQAQATPKMVAIPKDKDNDLKLYRADGSILKRNAGIAESGQDRRRHRVEN